MTYHYSLEEEVEENWTWLAVLEHYYTATLFGLICDMSVVVRMDKVPSILGISVLSIPVPRTGVHFNETTRCLPETEYLYNVGAEFEHVWSCTRYVNCRLLQAHSSIRVLRLCRFQIQEETQE